MSDARLRHAIAFEAARLMYDRVESEYFTAKRKPPNASAADRSNPPISLPTPKSAIRFSPSPALMKANPYRQPPRTCALHASHDAALPPFQATLIGSVMTGHVRKGSDIDIHLFSDSVGIDRRPARRRRLDIDVERKQVVKHNECRVFTHIHVETVQLRTDRVRRGQGPLRLQKFDHRQGDRTGFHQRARGADRREYPDVDLDEAVSELEEEIDPFQMFRLLLQPLDRVKQSPKYHPEGDVLYHLLQVFELAREERPYDEEFLLAALLHDVGKGIDPADHVAAAPMRLTD